MPDGYINASSVGLVLGRCMYSSVIDPEPHCCMGQIGIFAGAWVNEPKVSDGDANGAGADRVAAGGSPLGEVGVSARDFQEFLPKLELIS